MIQRDEMNDADKNPLLDLSDVVHKTVAALARNEGVPYLNITQPPPSNLKEIQQLEYYWTSFLLE